MKSSNHTFYPIPIVAPLCIILMAMFYQWLFVGGGNIISTNGCFERIGLDPIRFVKPTPNILSQINANRVLWVSTSFLNVIACFSAFAVGIVVLRTIFPTIERGGASRRAALAIPSGTVAISFLIGAGLTFIPHTEITDQLVGKMNQVFDTHGLLNLTLKFYDLLTFSAGCFLAMISTAILADRRATEPQTTGVDDPENNRPAVSPTNANRRLATQISGLRTILYASTAVLATAILRIDAFFGWTSAYAIPADKVDAEGLKQLFDNIAMTWGVYSTTLLLAIYLPTAWVISRRAERLASEANPDAALAEQTEWMRKHGLVISSFEQLQRVAAILSPILIGQFAVLFKKAG